MQAPSAPGHPLLVEGLKQPRSRRCFFWIEAAVSGALPESGTEL